MHILFQKSTKSIIQKASAHRSPITQAVCLARGTRKMSSDVITLSEIPTISALYKSSELQPAPPDSSTPEPSASLNSKVALIRTSITDLQVTSIVNAANRSLLGGGGVVSSSQQSNPPPIYYFYLYSTFLAGMHSTTFSNTPTHRTAQSTAPPAPPSFQNAAPSAAAPPAPPK